MSKTTFQIKNTFDSNLSVIHELEGFEFHLPPNEEITIEVESKDGVSILLNIGLANGENVIGIIPELSHYAVYYKGVNVFKEYLE